MDDTPKIRPTIADLPPVSADKIGFPWSEGSPEMPAHLPCPAISIIMPSYNQGQYLEEAIRSVILQNYPALEFILIDGGSTDQSLDIIQKYSRWLTYWVSEKDNGQSHAINKGFSRSTGQIMAWLNSDDFYEKKALQQVGQLLNNRPNSLLVGASIITKGADTRQGNYDRRQPSWAEVAYDAATFPQPSVFWTRQLWEKSGGLDQSLYFLMDYDLWLRMYYHADQIIFSEQVLSFARTHDAQKSLEPDRDALYQKLRAQVVVRAAQQRGEWLYLWLGRLWWRRWRKALSSRNFGLLRGSSYHHLVTRSVLRQRFF